MSIDVKKYNLFFISISLVPIWVWCLSQKIQDMQLYLQSLEQDNGALQQESKELQTQKEELQSQLTKQLQENETLNKQLEHSITLRYPYVVSSHEFSKGLKGDSNEPAFLFLEMLHGNYDPTQTFWNGTWSGMFRFRVVFGNASNSRFEPDSAVEYDEAMPGEVISEPMFLSFPKDISFHFEDYNDDGLPDFIISQWGALSAGDYCGVFTIRESGKVEMLSVRGDLRTPSMFGTVQVAKDASESGNGFFYPHFHGVSPALEVLHNPSGFAVYYGTPRGLENVFMENTLQEIYDYNDEYYKQYGEPAWALRDKWKDSNKVVESNYNPLVLEEL